MKKKLNWKSIIFGSVIIGLSIIGSYISTSYALTENGYAIHSENVEYKDNSNLGVTQVQAAIDGTCTKIDNRLSDIENNNFLNSHPIGSIYITVSDAEKDAKDVAELYGGEWVKFGEGKTLIGDGTGTDANDNTQTFSVANNSSNLGEYTHQLTIDEMPSHTHQQVIYTTKVNNVDGNITQNAVEANLGWFTTTTGSPTGLTKSEGGDKEHNNLQPYITVYMYKRVQ